MGVLQTKSQPQPLFRDEENEVDPNFNDGQERNERHDEAPPAFSLNSHGEPVVHTLWKW